MKVLDCALEPANQLGATLSCRPQQNSELQFANDDGVNHQIKLVIAYPIDDMARRLLFGRLTQNVGVDQVLHNQSVESVSVDSVGIG